MGLSEDCFEYRSHYDRSVGAAAACDDVGAAPACDDVGAAPGCDDVGAAPACDDVGAAPAPPGLAAHAETCSACAAWRNQVDDISHGVAHIPMFDVSEQLTQRILSAVEQQAKPPALVNFWLLLPVAVVCAALGFTVMPFDSIEGAASTAVGLVGLALFYVLVRAARTEELPA